MPAALLAGWGLAGSTMVEALINGVGVGRRSLKPWDAERRFIGVAQPM